MQVPQHLAVVALIARPGLPNTTLQLDCLTASTAGFSQISLRFVFRGDDL
jgi:hypothetical protein